MEQLRALQQRFQSYLTGHANDIENDIVSTDEALAEHRLATYYNAYRIRLIDALAVDYSAIEKTLGRDKFENIALDYLKEYPSSHASVRWFGQSFSDYLARHSEHEDYEFLSELANFEWSQGLVFDATNETSLFQLENMATVPPEAWPGLVVEFKPAMRWLDLSWNVCPYATAVEEAGALPEKHRGQIPQRWLIWRKNQNLNWRSLDVHEGWAIEVAKQGGNFAELCEGLCEWISEDQVAVTAAGFLKQWISDELVIDIAYEPNPDR